MKFASLVSLLFAAPAIVSAAEVVRFRALSQPSAAEQVKLEKSAGIKYSATRITGELMQARGYHDVLAVRTKAYGEVHLPMTPLAGASGRAFLEKLLEKRAIVVVTGTLKSLCTPEEVSSLAAKREQGMILTCYVVSDAFPAELSIPQ